MKRGTLVASVIVASCIAGNAYAFKIVSFDGKFTRWEKSQIHYAVDSRGSRYFDSNADSGCDKYGSCRTVRQIATDSFQSWANVPGVKLEFIEDSPQVFNDTGYDKKNSLIWVGKGWTSLSFNPPPSALAVTISTYRTSDGVIVDSDIHMNEANFTWADIDSDQEKNGNYVDLQNIMTHEIGHFVGLDHSSENLFEPVQKFYLATMFYASGPGELFRRDLDEDDNEAASNLYPSSEPNQPVVDLVSPDSIDASISKFVNIQIQGRNFNDNSAAVIAIKGDYGDIAGQTVSISPNEMNVAFDISKIPSGKYDVIVANTHDKMDRLEAGITISGSFVSNTTGDGSGFASDASGGGCALSDERGPISSLILLLLPLILIGASRFALTKKQKS